MKRKEPDLTTKWLKIRHTYNDNKDYITTGKNVKMKSKMSTNYRHTYAKDGSFSPRLSKSVTKRVNHYCESQNINKTKFVENCIIERLDVLEKEALSNMSKEMLVELLLSQYKN